MRFPDRLACCCLFLALCAGASACASTPSPGGGERTALLAGRVVQGDQALAGARVNVFSRADAKGQPLAQSAPTGPEGTYSLRLPPGRYTVTAGKGELWAYSGQNPVSLAAGDELWLGFDLVRWQQPRGGRAVADPYSGRLEGVVLLRGEPVAGVTVSLYLDAEGAFRGPAYLRALPTGEDGSFLLEMVPEGSYFLVARKRSSGLVVGPMLQGDLFSYHRYNPLMVKGGGTLVVELPLLEKRLDRDVNGMGLPGEEAGFSGTITDGEGMPVPGLHVFAYLDPDMGHHKPAAVSSLSDEEGRYLIFLPGPGTYYVGARDGFGDSPAPGELFGFYQGSPGHSLTLEGGESREGVDIVVHEVLPP